MFITITDLYSKIRQSDLNQIVGADDTVVEHAMIYAVGLIRSYICERYDAKQILSATGDEREGLLVSMAVDIAIYEVVALARPNIDMTDRRERRNQAIEYLRQASDGRPTGWPLLSPELQTSEGSVEHGGRAARSNYF